MTSEQIKYSIETGEMKLVKWRKFTHYEIVGTLFILPAMVLFLLLKDYFQGAPRSLRESDIWFMIIPSILGLLLYRIQKNRLKFKYIDTKLTREELNSIIEKVAEELEWIPYLNNQEIIIAKTHPGFFSGSWGEQITILFDKNRVLVNSICDPSKRSSVVSMGRNKRNINRLIEEITKANSKEKSSE